MNDTCRKYDLKTTDECKFFNGIIERIKRLKIKTVRKEFIAMLENELNNNDEEYSNYDEDDEEYKKYDEEYKKYDEEKEYGFYIFDHSKDENYLRRKYPLYDLSLEMNKKVNEYIGHLKYLYIVLDDINTLMNRGYAKDYLLGEFKTLLNENNIYKTEDGGNIPALRSYIFRFNNFDKTKRGGARKRSKSKKRSKSHKRTKSRSKK